jgi:hypothetical protein
VLAFQDIVAELLSHLIILFSVILSDVFYFLHFLLAYAKDIHVPAFFFLEGYVFLLPFLILNDEYFRFPSESPLILLFSCDDALIEVEHHDIIYHS